MLCDVCRQVRIRSIPFSHFKKVTADKSTQADFSAPEVDCPCFCETKCNSPPPPIEIIDLVSDIDDSDVEVIGEEDTMPLPGTSLLEVALPEVALPEVALPEAALLTGVDDDGRGSLITIG